MLGDCLERMGEIPDGSAHCCVTSPPYFGLRDYGVPGQLGLEKTPAEYVARMVDVFREVRRVLMDDATLWLNLGDSYSSPNGGSRTTSCKQSSNKGSLVHPTVGLSIGPKQLLGIPWRVAFALQADGWYLRSDIIWHKPNPMPESVTDRPTKAHEYLFLLSKRERYYYDADAVRELSCRPELGMKTRRIGAVEQQGTMRGDIGRVGVPYCNPLGRNRRTVWTVATRPYKGAHFATFPPALVEPCILAGCPEGGTVLDPFAGSGTTGAVALEHRRRFVGIELNADYLALAEDRLAAARPVMPLFAGVGT